MHAFARTARECGIGEAQIRPFFASMRTDLLTARHDAASHDDYVYGSAEVVGLMCLQVFVNAGAQHPAVPDAELVDGARRLGAAFQDVNFLRDLHHDEDALGRDYLGLASGASDRIAVLDRIDADLAAAAAVIPRLPADCRRAVTAAHDLFAALSLRLRRDSASEERVRVPDAVKATLAARAWLGFAPRNQQNGARTRMIERDRTTEEAQMADDEKGAAVVIGAGIAGLATAALLGAEGWDVTILEARDEIGGRAGSWEQDGFRFDTGPSWYLMPEVFDHFFRLLGTTAERELDLVRLDPAYRVYSQPSAERTLPPTDVQSGRAEATALFEAIEPGAGAKLDLYLDSAADAYELSVSRFLYDTYETHRRSARPASSCAAPASWRPCSRVRSRATSTGGSPTRGCARSWATRPCSSAARRTACRASTT